MGLRLIVVNETNGKQELRVLFKLKLLLENFKRFFMSVDLEGISFQINVPKQWKNEIDHQRE
jgi:hypothetical protein